MSKKITFTLPAEVVAGATAGILLGDFNNWDYTQGVDLKKQKDGSLKAIITLEVGQTYQYRFLLNDGRWVNDHSAESFVHVEGLQVENCVITVSADVEIVSAEPVEIVAAPTPVPAKTSKVTKTKEVKATEPVVEPVADDLTKIEGVGKKIAELLVVEGIESFQALSKATAKKLKAVLDAAGSKFAMHDPATWPKQAKLANAGKWDELKAMQDELKGGK
ncbi:MAG: helix-hairpin-helix domain-containing protein [Chitinophagaceae bacterium]